MQGMIFLLPPEEIGREKKEKEENRRKDKGQTMYLLWAQTESSTAQKLISHLIHGGWYLEKCISGLLAAKMGKRPWCTHESRDSFAASAGFAAPVLNSVSETGTFKEMWVLSVALLDWT